MEKKMILHCTLPLDLGCSHRTNTNTCAYSDSACSFCEKEENVVDKKYERKERWYEKYYKDSRPIR